MKTSKYLLRITPEGWKDLVFQYKQWKKNIKTMNRQEIIKAFLTEIYRVSRHLESFTNRLRDILTYAPMTLEQNAALLVVFHELALFVMLNQLSIRKMLKKIDKDHSKLATLAIYPQLGNAVIDNRLEIVHINLIGYLEQVSDRLHHAVVTTGNTNVAESKGDEQTFIRSTTKYWVPLERVADVQIAVVKHLPLLQFNSSIHSKTNEAWVSSVYLDSKPEFSLYHDRIQRKDGSKAVRIRWYGSELKDSVFLERKIHREGWSGNSSVKERITITFEDLQRWLLSSENKPFAIDNTTLGAEIDEMKRIMHLQPVIQTVCQRSAFQVSRTDASIRVSLDTNLFFMSQSNPTEWNPWLTQGLTNAEKSHFPYAILEVKLKDTEQPLWLTELLQNEWIIHSPNFSKYAQAVYSFYPDKCKTIPYWLNSNSNNSSTVALLDSEPDSLKEKKRTQVLPMKIEPKTYFANERTFIQWVSMSFSLLVFAVGVLLYSSPNSKYLFYGFSLFPLAILVYAVCQFLKRDYALKHRQHIAVADRTGPIVLFCFLFVSMIAIVTIASVYSTTTSSSSNVLINDWCVSMQRIGDMRYEVGGLAMTAEDQTMFMVSRNLVLTMNASKPNVLEATNVHGWISDEEYDFEGIAIDGTNKYMFLASEWPGRRSIVILHRNDMSHPVAKPLVIESLFVEYNDIDQFEGITILNHKPDDGWILLVSGATQTMHGIWVNSTFANYKPLFTWMTQASSHIADMFYVSVDRLLYVIYEEQHSTYIETHIVTESDWSHQFTGRMKLPTGIRAAEGLFMKRKSVFIATDSPAQLFKLAMDPYTQTVTLC